MVERVSVAIVGAGMSGLFMGFRLRELGVDFKIYEKAKEVGGTWRENAYPGLHVDQPVSAYQLSFAPKYDWSRAFAPGPEIQEYLVETADKYDLRDSIRFGTEMVEGRWEDGHWCLQSADGHKVHALGVVFATGFLHQPRLPQIEGMESFEGKSFHSTGWPEDLNVVGKRVGVLGMGSSGIQITSALAHMDCKVTQFVRTPQWIEVVKNPPSSQEMRETVRHSPELGMTKLTELEEGIGIDPRLKDLRWKIEPGPLRENAERALRENLLIIRDPELRQKLTPNFPPGCKRIPKSDSYYEAVQEPNVHVHVGPIERIEPRGIVTPDGVLHTLDVLVYATGFDAHAYMRPMRVYGIGGTCLDDVWRDGPFAYKGVSVPAFPNMFLLNGPFAPVNTITPPKTLEHQARYVCQLISTALSESVGLMPTSAATEAFCDRIEAALQPTVWASSGCDNWYKSKRGVAIVWPWLEEEYRDMFADLAMDEIERVRPRSSAGAVPSVSSDGEVFLSSR